MISKSRHKLTILSSKLGKTTNFSLEGITTYEYQQINLPREFRFTKTNRTGSTFPAFQYSSRFRSEFEEADVVYALYFPDLQFVCLYMQFVTHTPVVLGHHNPLDRLRVDRSRVARLAYRFLVPTNIRMEAMFSAHHVLNDRELNGFLRYGAKNVFKIPNGVHVNFFPNREKFDTFTLLFVGRLSYQKGIDLIPKIVQTLNTKLVDYKFYIIGNGDLSDLITTIRSNRVNWLGYVSEELKNQYLMRSHLLIAPSRYEAFPITGLEALAAGTPIVTFDIPGPREFVINDYNGYLVRSLDEMCNKIVETRERYINGTYWDLVKNAKASARNFDWSVIVPKIESMLEKVHDL